MNHSISRAHSSPRPRCHSAVTTRFVIVALPSRESAKGRKNVITSERLAKACRARARQGA